MNSCVELCLSNHLQYYTPASQDGSNIALATFPWPTLWSFDSRLPIITMKAREIFFIARKIICIASYQSCAMLSKTQC